MARDNDIKNFLYGYLIGQKPLGRERAPVDIPVTIVNIGYNSDTLTVGESMILTASVYPSDASYQEVEWSSSDINVLAVNKTTALSAEVRAISTGDVTITCKATDGYGATGTVIIHVQAGMTFETLSVNQTLSSRLTDIRVATALIELNYTPVAMNGNLLNIEMAAPLSGNPTPFIIENTMFDNVKLIKNTFIGRTQEDYLNYSTGSLTYLRYSVRAQDGSGLLVSDVNIPSVAGTQLYESLYGQPGNISQFTGERWLKVGYQCRLTGLFNNFTGYQSIYLKDMTVEIDDDTLIEVSNDWIITGVKAGDTTVKVTLVDGRTGVCTLHIVSEATRASAPGIEIIDSTGQRVRMSYYGALNLVSGETYKGVGAMSTNTNGSVVKAIASGDVDVAVINSDGTFTVIGDGSTRITFERTYNASSGEVTNTTNETIQVYASGVNVGTCTSDYIKSGVVVYAYTHPNVYYSDGYCKNRISVSFNSNQARLVSIVKSPKPNELNTVTYTPEFNAYSGTVNYYQFEKYTTGDVVLTFMVEGFPDTATQITI